MEEDKPKATPAEQFEKILDTLDPALIDDVVCDFPSMDLAQWAFLLASSSDAVCPNKDVIREKAMEYIREHQMELVYRDFCERFHWPVDAALAESMKAHNDSMTARLDAKIEDAVENMGENEVRLATLARANFLCQAGYREEAIAGYLNVIKKTVGVGRKMEACFTLIRIGFFFDDTDVITKYLEEARKMTEHKDSDWERRNRLLVYEAVYNMSIRKFSVAGELLLKTLATFSAVELMEHSRFIYYVIVMALVGLPRETLREKVMESPDVLGTIEKLPHIGDMLHGLYKCEYSRFMLALGEITEEMKSDRFLVSHAGNYCREMRVRAYTQYLQSYRSVTLTSMASAFGVTTEFLDAEVSRFVAAGRLSAKVDKVAGIIETARPDMKSAWYLDTLRAGDSLLGRMEKLARVISS